MTTFALHLIVIAYAGVAVVSTLGYLPTIKDLALHKKMSANVASYAIWTTSTGISFTYSLFILQDTLFRIVSGLSFVNCALILLLSIGLMRRARAASPKEQALSQRSDINNKGAT